MKKKWFVFGLILIITVLGIGIYFLVSGSADSVINVGGSVPRPPALPS